MRKTGRLLAFDCRVARLNNVCRAVGDREARYVIIAVGDGSDGICVLCRTRYSDEVVTS